MRETATGVFFVWEQLMDFTHLTSPEKAKALRKLASGYSITASMKAAGYTRQTYYNWRADDPEFDALAEEALESGTDEVEDEAWRQGKRGNATLLITILKARRPEKYKDRSLNEHTGADGEPFAIVFRERSDGPQ